MAENIYVFDKQPDIFEVSGLDQKKDRAGRVIDGYVYRWVNDSEDQAMNFEQKRREYWEVAKDKELKAQFSNDRSDGEAFVIKRNNERYVLCKRPVEASDAQFEAENAAKRAALERNNTNNNSTNVKTGWQLINRNGKEEEESFDNLSRKRRGR